MDGGLYAPGVQGGFKQKDNTVLYFATYESGTNERLLGKSRGHLYFIMFESETTFQFKANDPPLHHVAFIERQTPSSGALTALELLSWRHFDRGFPGIVTDDEIHGNVFTVHVFIHPVFDVSGHSDNEAVTSALYHGSEPTTQASLLTCTCRGNCNTCGKTLPQWERSKYCSSTPTRTAAARRPSKDVGEGENPLSGRGIPSKPESSAPRYEIQ